MSDWDDLYERLQKAERKLEEMAVTTRNQHTHDRLVAKAAGVALALDYVRGYGHHGKNGSGADQ